MPDNSHDPHATAPPLTPPTKPVTPAKELKSHVVEGIKKFKTVIEIIEGVSTIGIALNLLKRNADGKKEFNKEAIRGHLPHFAKDKEDEARWAQLVTELSSGEQTALLQHFMPSMHEVEQADFILSAAEMSYGDDPHTSKLNSEKTVKMLKRMAAIGDNNLRRREAASLNFVKENSTDYWIIKIENLVGQRFSNAQHLGEWLASPDGLALYVQRFYNSLDRAAQEKVTPRIISLRNLLGVTIQTEVADNSPTLLTQPSLTKTDKVKGWFTGLQNTFSLANRARRFK